MIILTSLLILTIILLVLEGIEELDSLDNDNLAVVLFIVLLKVSVKIMLILL